MKTRRHWIIVVVITIIGIIAGFGGCSNHNDPTNVVRNQNATIPLINGQNTAIVRGYMTNAQWEGVADSIAKGINLMYEYPWVMSTENIIAVLERGIIIIVEVEPNGFTRLKTTDERTIHFALSYAHSFFTVGAGDFAGAMSHWIVDGIFLLHVNRIEAH